MDSVKNKVKRIVKDINFIVIKYQDIGGRTLSTN